jgi:hypothetical protein
VEVDPWLQYTEWYDVFNKSKHDLVRTTPEGFDDETETG